MSQRRQTDTDEKLRNSEDRSKTSTIKFKDSNSGLNKSISSVRPLSFDLKADSSDEEIRPSSSKRNLSVDDRSNLFRDSKATSRSKKTSQSPPRRSERLEKTINEDSDSNELAENAQGSRQTRSSKKFADSICEDEIIEPKLVNVRSRALENKINDSLKARSFRQSSDQNPDQVSSSFNSDKASFKQSSKFSRLERPNLGANTKSFSQKQDLRAVESRESNRFLASPAQSGAMSNRMGEPNMHECLCPKYNICDWSMEMKYEILKKMENEIMKMCPPKVNRGCNSVVKSNEPELDKGKKSSISLPLSYETVLTNHLNENPPKCTEEKKCEVKSCGFNVNIKETAKKEKIKKTKTDEEKKGGGNSWSFKKMFNFSSKSRPESAKEAKKKDKLEPKACKSHCHSECTFMRKKDGKSKKKCEKVMVVRKMMVPILITEEIDDSDCDNEFADSECKTTNSNENVRIDEIGRDFNGGSTQCIGPATKENKEAATDHVEHMDANTEISEIIDKRDKHTLTKTCMSKDVQTFTQIRQCESEERKNKNKCTTKCCCRCPGTSNTLRSSIAKTRSGVLQNRKSTLPNVLPGRSFSCRCKKENQFNSTKAYPVKICYNDSKCLMNNRILSEIKQTYGTGSKKCPCCVCADNETANQNPNAAFHARKCQKINCHENVDVGSDCDGAPPMICVYCDKQKGTCNCETRVQSFFESRDCDSTIESNFTQNSTPFSNVLTELQKRIRSNSNECNCEMNCCRSNANDSEGRLNVEGKRISFQTKSKTTIISEDQSRQSFARPAAKCFYCKILPCRCPSSVNVFNK